MESIESLFGQVADLAALILEFVAVGVIVVGAVQAVIGLVRPSPEPDPTHPLGPTRIVWLRFGGRLLLGLEFTLAADVVRTAASPTWNDIGMLAAIALIRTFLSFFLERDLTKIAREASIPAEEDDESAVVPVETPAEHPA